jgi:hypothetical protein
LVIDEELGFTSASRVRAEVGEFNDDALGAFAY